MHLLRRYDYPRTAPRDREADRGVREAAIRQFPWWRLLSYGVEMGDAIRLLDMINDGYSWKESALELARALELQLSDDSLRGSPVRDSVLHQRISALLRLAQTMMLHDDDERRTIFAEAVEHYELSKKTDPRFERVLIDTSGGPIAGWKISPIAGEPSPAVLVQGGQEGWAMEWEEQGLALAAEGLTAVMIDGPGQGETRLVHEHYMTQDWLRSYAEITEFLLAAARGLPVGIVGNSMAGCVATLAAERYPAFRAVCNNGGPESLARFFRSSNTWLTKCRRLVPPTFSEAEALEVYETLDLSRERIDVRAPYLLVQGAEDPMVTVAESERILERIMSADQEIALFEGGEHTVSRYPSDKFLLMSNWFATHLESKQDSFVGSN